MPDIAESIETSATHAALPSTLPNVAKFYAPLASTMMVVWGGRAADDIIAAPSMVLWRWRHGP
ncbi:MAG: hypothetical protein R3C68_07420 [Myxococcota bacterium]